MFDPVNAQLVAVFACFGVYPLALFAATILRYRYRPAEDRTDDEAFLLLAVPSTSALASTIGGMVANSLGLETSVTYFAAAEVLALSLLIVGVATIVDGQEEEKKPRGPVSLWLTGFAIGSGVLVIVNSLVLAGLVIRLPIPS
jgi:hypothetical protein